MMRLPFLTLLVCLWAPSALAWEARVWEDKPLSIALDLDYTRSWRPEGSTQLGDRHRAVLGLGLQSILKPLALDFKASFDRSYDLGVGLAWPLQNYHDGWFALTALAVGRAAGREFSDGPTRTDHRFAFTFGPAVRAEYLGYLASWSVFLELRQMLIEPVDTSICLGASFSPLAILQWRQMH
jgi:hypothetical protein